VIEINELAQWIAIAFLLYWASKLHLAITSLGKALKMLTEVIEEDAANGGAS
jgi:hypothetical protein